MTVHNIVWTLWVLQTRIIAALLELPSGSDGEVALTWRDGEDQDTTIPSRSAGRGLPLGPR
jgi:hypothetical protein